MYTFFGRAAASVIALFSLAPFAIADMPQMPISPTTGAHLLVKDGGSTLWIVTGIFVIVTVLSLAGLWALRRQRVREEAASVVSHDAPA